MATELTSAVAKIAPTKMRAKVTMRTGQSAMAEPPLPCSSGLTFGSLARCRMKAVMPKARNNVLASMPASGNRATERPTDSEAPAM